MSDYLTTDPALMLMAGGALPQALPPAAQLSAQGSSDTRSEFSRLLTRNDFPGSARGETPDQAEPVPAASLLTDARPAGWPDRGREPPGASPAAALPDGKTLPPAGQRLPLLASLPAGPWMASDPQGLHTWSTPLPEGAGQPAPGTPPGLGYGIGSGAAPDGSWQPGSGERLSAALALSAPRPSWAFGEPGSGNTPMPGAASLPAGATAAEPNTFLMPLAAAERQAAGSGIAELAAGLRAQFGWRAGGGSAGQSESVSGPVSSATLAAPAFAPVAFSAAVQDPGAVLPPLSLPQGTTGLESWSRSLGSQLVFLAGQGTTTAQLRLDPEALGPLSVTIELDDDQAQLRFNSPHAATREALESALPRLRELFAEQGLQLVRADVGDGEGGAGTRQSAGDPPGRQPGWNPARPDPAAAGSPAISPLLASLLPTSGSARLLDTWA